MPSFQEYSSYKRLFTLSQNPLDLTKEGVLDEKRVKSMQVFSCGYKMVFATECICQKTYEALLDLAKEANVVSLMERMQKGEILNKIEGYSSENRPVLHTAMRDLFGDAFSSPVAEKAAKKAQIEIDKLSEFTRFLDKSSTFTDLIQIGIGGSDLGPRALYQALLPYSTNHRRVHFVSNIDPDDLAATIKQVDLSKTLVVIVSKSGTTLETKTNEEILRDGFKQKGLDPQKHCIAITGEKSPMDDPTRYLETFYIWDYVGGRYSATSMVGGVVLSFAFGVDVFKELLRGAHEMDRAACNYTVEDNLPLMGALIGIWNRDFLHLPTMAIVPYSSALKGLVAHLQQCDMESNGKRIDKTGKPVSFQTGPVIWGDVGTNGQHSFFQWLHQATQRAALEMIGFQKSQVGWDKIVDQSFSQEKLLSNLIGQSIALATGKRDENPNKYFEGNRPNHLLLAKQLNPKTMGALLAYYEHKIAFQGFLWNINSFDQEGVQYGKVLSDKILGLYRAKREGKKGIYPLGEAFIREIENLE